MLFQKVTGNCLNSPFVSFEYENKIGSMNPLLSKSFIIKETGVSFDILKWLFDPKFPTKKSKSPSLSLSIILRDIVLI